MQPDFHSFGKKYRFTTRTTPFWAGTEEVRSKVGAKPAFPGATFGPAHCTHGKPSIGIPPRNEPNRKEAPMSHQQFASCIEACNACALACSHCATSSLDEEDPKAMARCIRLDLDCAATCKLAVEVMGRGSENASTICAACAEICEVCAEECGQHQMDHCQTCAQACRQCASACRSMAQQPAGTGQSTSAHAH